MLLACFRTITRQNSFLPVRIVKFHGLGRCRVLSLSTLTVAFLLLLGSAVVGRLFDAGYMTQMLIVGSVLLIFATCMQSLSTEWYQLFLYVIIYFPDTTDHRALSLALQWGCNPSNILTLDCSLLVSHAYLNISNVIVLPQLESWHQGPQ
jgi:hypothetical protein